MAVLSEQLRPSLDEDSGVLDSHTVIARVGMVITAAFLLQTGLLLGVVGAPSVHLRFLLGTFACYGCGFLFLLFGVRNTVSPRRANLLILVAVTGAMFLTFWATVGSGKYTSDSLAFSHASAVMVIHGQNPYAVRDRAIVSQLARRYGVFSITTENGGQTTHQMESHPAGDFLIFAPGVALGLKDLRWITTSSTILVIIVLWWSAPKMLQPLVALPILVDFNHVFLSPIEGTADELWVLPILITVIAMNRRRYDLAAFMFGLACSLKQEPWLLAPFLLIWLWQEAESGSVRQKLAPLSRFALISLIVFLLPNLPFILWQPTYWLEGVGYQFIDNVTIEGVGLAALTHQGWIILSRDFYSLAATAVMLGLIAAYYKYFSELKHCIWAFPPIVLWFTYRSLPHYFFYWTPIVMLAVLIRLNDEITRHEAVSSGVSLIS